jgi:flagellar biosynthesis protein FlhG
MSRIQSTVGLSRHALHPAAGPIGKNMVTVASGKGGVGKTWLAVTLAHAMARGGRRVVLFDGDLGLANVDIQLGLMPDRDIGGVIGGRFKLADAITHYPQGGFDIIAGKSGSGALAAMDQTRLTGLRDELAGLARQYDMVVLDLGAGLDNTVRTLSQNDGPKLVLTTADPTSLTDAYAFIKVMHAKRPGADLRIVVNMADSIKDGERTYNKLLKACKGFLRIAPPLAGIIPRDAAVVDAIRHQSPLLVRHPSAPAAAQLDAVVKSLWSRK